MTKEEFLKRYGLEWVQFSSYYKYSFCFNNPESLFLQAGGRGADIYRCEIVPKMQVQDIENETGNIVYATYGGELLGRWDEW